LTLDDEAKEFLIEKGYNPDFGARPLRRAIEHHIEDPVSEGILRAEYKGKTRILVSVQAGEGEDEKRLSFKAEGEAPNDGQEELAEVHEGT
jgi:ATP-dependent Clp protease ATP-binding subunit ClpC